MPTQALCPHGEGCQHGFVVAEVDRFADAVGREHRFEAVAQVVDVGEVALHLAVVEHVDRFAFELEDDITRFQPGLLSRAALFDGIDDGAQEEAITTQHTNGLIEMWVSNPKVFNWFAKTLRAMKREAKKDEE